MDKIYIAIKSLLKDAKESTKNSTEISSFDRGVLSLLSFEQRNRGHQHLLASESLNPGNVYRNNSMTSEDHSERLSRRYTLQSTSRALFDLIMSSESEWINDPRLNDLLMAEDKTGWLLLHLLSKLKFYADYSAPNFRRIKNTSINLINDEIILGCNLIHPPTGLIASREFRFKVEGKMTLRNARSTLINSKRIIKSEFEKMDNWPEFSNEKCTDFFIRSFAKKTSDIFKSHTKEQQKLIIENWSKIRPF